MRQLQQPIPTGKSSILERNKHPAPQMFKDTQRYAKQPTNPCAVTYACARIRRLVRPEHAA
jgi:hypothetical protein